MFKTRRGSYCTYCCTSSCFLYFIKYQKIPHQYHFTKLLLMAIYTFLFLKLPGALKFLLSSSPSPSTQSQVRTTQLKGNGLHILHTFRQVPPCYILFRSQAFIYSVSTG